MDDSDSGNLRSIAIDVSDLLKAIDEIKDDVSESLEAIDEIKDDVSESLEDLEKLKDEIREIKDKASHLSSLVVQVGAIAVRTADNTGQLCIWCWVFAALLAAYLLGWIS